MSSSVWAGGPDLASAAGNALSAAARCWFVALVAGQWIFAGSVMFSHGGSLVMGMHLLMALIVVVGGPLQMIPELRRHAPRLHHWNGRLYMLAVFAISITGLHLVWSRGRADLVQQLWVSLHAVLVMSFAALALHRAISRDFSAHRRWALRMWMVLNAGWFFRIGLTRWIFLDQPAGGSAGGFLNVMSLTDYLLPLVVLEIYLRARDFSASSRLAVAFVLLLLTMAMTAGFCSAAAGRWL